MTSRSCSFASEAIPSSFARDRTPPVGLQGVSRTIAFVRGVVFARISSRLGSKPFPSVSEEETGFAPKSAGTLR